MAYNGPDTGVINVILRDKATSGVTVAISPPSADVGSDGDFAFDPNTNTLWGPKDSTQASPWANTGAGSGQGLRNRGTWSSTGTYYANDVVFNPINNQQYICVKAIDYSGQAPWVAQNYEPGSFVTYGGLLYIAIVNPTSSGVPGSSAAWVGYSLDAELAYQGYAAFGNFIQVPPALAVNAYFDGLNKTTTWTIPQRSLLDGGWPLNPSGVYLSATGNPVANYLVDSKAIESSGTLALSQDVNTLSAQSSLNTGAGTSVEIKSLAVSTGLIKDSAVTNAKLDKTAGSQAVSTGAIRDLAVTTAKLADDSVTSAKIVAGTIATSDIANGAITQPLLAASAVGETNISPYLTTGTNSPSAYFPNTKLVSADTTLSGGTISTTNKAVDGKSLNYGLNGYAAPNGQVLSVGSRTATANQVWWTRFYCPADITITKLACQITTASASATDWVDMGIYSTAGVLLASTGQTTGTNVVTALVGTLGAGTGAKAGSANYALTGGTTYYIAAMSSAALSYGSCMGTSGIALYGTTAGQFMVANATATGTTTSLNAATISFPSTVTVTNTTGAGVLFIVRTA